MGNLLSGVFNSRSIKLDLDGKTKEMVFAELIDGIADVYPGCNRSELLAAVREREEKMNTGIGSGIAVPHALCRGICGVAGAIGISQHGIDYGALDNEPVHVIFLLTMNKNAEETHLRILSEVFKLAQSQMIVLLKNAKKAQDIHSILSQFH